MIKYIKSRLSLIGRFCKKYCQRLKGKNIKRIITVLLILTVFYLTKSIFVAAIVNNYPISRYSVIKELEKQGGEQVLDAIINERLIFQEASKKKISITKEEVDSEISKIEENLKSQGTDLETALSLQGQTRDDLNKAIRLKLLIEKVLSDRITVGEDEIKTYFENNKSTLYKGKLYSDVKESISSVLSQQKLASEYQTWIAEVKGKAKIVKLLQIGRK